MRNAAEAEATSATKAERENEVGQVQRAEGKRLAPVGSVVKGEI